MHRAPFAISIYFMLTKIIRPIICLVVFAASRLLFAAPAPKLNVLFLIADDLNCDLGCYGAPGLKTPHIDALAARGVRFERAYCQFPLCSPSRSSFLTGRSPNATGVLTNPGGRGDFRTHFRNKITNTITLPQLFKQQGWFAARVGKLYHYGVPADIGTSSLDDFASWDLVINPRGRDREEHAKIFSLKPGQLGATLSWLADDEGEDTDHSDGIGATEAVRLLERFKKNAEPFFLAVGFYRPHTPYVAPKKYFELYPLDQIILPKLSADDLTRTPAAAYASALPEQDAATDDQRRLAIQAYHASISFMDAQVGRVVAALDRLGLTDQTVIVFTSDHGYHLGDHGLWQKRSLFERSARVPLIIAAPGAKANGQSTRSIAELLDVYPTLAGLAGLSVPSYLDGRNQQPVLNDVTATVRTSAISQSGLGTANDARVAAADGYTIRTDRWRYIEWGTGATMQALLFDEEKDPAETTNLAADPAYADTVAELRAQLAPARRQR